METKLTQLIKKAKKAGFEVKFIEETGNLIINYEGNDYQLQDVFKAEDVVYYLKGLLFAVHFLQ